VAWSQRTQGIGLIIKIVGKGEGVNLVVKKKKYEICKNNFINRFRRYKKKNKY